MIAVWVLAAATTETDLVAAAAASGRPPECLPAFDVAGEAATVWSRARVPALGRYCQLIARAQARLDADPAAAERAARAAATLLPGHATHQVILARLSLRAGKLEEALASFERALAADRRALDQPAALRDHALALRRAGKLEEALAGYRVLVPRASLLATRGERARVLLEAAHASMALAARTDAGGEALDEALAYLRAIADDPHHELRIDVTVSLALVLDRAGRPGQADALLAELGAEQVREWDGPGDYLADERDRAALRALAIEHHDEAAGHTLWQSYLGAGSGAPEPLARSAWRAAAEARVAALRGRPKGAR